MNVSNMSSDELVSLVQMSESPTKLEVALSNKIMEAKAEVTRVQEVFFKLSLIVDPEL